MHATRFHFGAQVLSTLGGLQEAALPFVRSLAFTKRRTPEQLMRWTCWSPILDWKGMEMRQCLASNLKHWICPVAGGCRGPNCSSSRTCKYGYVVSLGTVSSRDSISC